MNRNGLSATQRVAIVFIVIGALLAGLGLLIGGPFVAGALAAFGASAIVGGVHSVATRQHRTGRFGSSFLPRVHTGVSAVIFGLAFIVVGSALVVAGVAAMVGGGDELWSQLAERPGIVAIGLGAGIVLLGVATAVSRWTFESESTVWWQRLPGMLLGVLLVGFGAVVLAMGWSLARSPPASDELLEEIASTVTRWLGVD